MAVELQAGAARDEVLRRIRRAIGSGASGAETIHAEWQTLPRNYKSSAALDRDALVEMLEDRLRDYDAVVVRAKSGSIASEMVRMLKDRGLHRLIVPNGLPEAIGEPLPEGFDFIADDNLSSTELDQFEGVVTASTVAIAETGTIVLQNVPGQGRRAPTLIPDYHLCVVRLADVVETVPEAMERLAGTASLATTFISGPSATADIEMTRIKGVHGPRFLDVILVE